MNIRHEATGCSDGARIRIAGLENDIGILHLTDSHITEADERDPAAIPYAKRRGENGFYGSTPNNETTLEVFSRSLTKAREMNVDAVVMTGDIVDFAAWAGIEHVAREMKALGVPALYAPGNHDWHLPHLDWSEATREECYPRLHGLTGNTPACQSMQLGGVRLIAIDNSTYQVSPAQVSFLRRELATGQPCLLFMHIPIWIESLVQDVMKKWQAPIMMATPHGWTEEMRIRWKVAGNDPSTLECFELLTQGKSENLVGIFCGHVHFDHVDSYREGRWQYVARAGYCGSYRIIELLK